MALFPPLLWRLKLSASPRLTSPPAGCFWRVQFPSALLQGLLYAQPNAGSCPVLMREKVFSTKTPFVLMAFGRPEKASQNGGK